MLLISTLNMFPSSALRYVLASSALWASKNNQASRYTSI